MTDIVEDIRAAYADINGPWGRTHYPDCYADHALCAIRVLLDLVDELRDEVTRTAAYVAQLGEIVHDLTTRLEVDQRGPDHESEPVQTMNDEAERLRRWKAEAIAVGRADEDTFRMAGLRPILGRTLMYAAVAEIERLRSLITEWADARDGAISSVPSTSWQASQRLDDAVGALRAEVGR